MPVSLSLTDNNLTKTWADPESFARGGKTLITIFYMSGERIMRAIIGPPAKRHLMAFHLQADDAQH